MKTRNILVSIIILLIYQNLSNGENFWDAFSGLASSVILTGIIMFFKKDRSNWSAILMWVVIILCITSFIIEEINYPNKYFNSFGWRDAIKY